MGVTEGVASYLQGGEVHGLTSGRLLSTIRERVKQSG